MYGEHYVFRVNPKVGDDEGGEEEGEEGEEGEEEIDVENAEVGQLLPKERSLIRKLRVTKFEVAVSIFC